jgi:cell division protein FtsN
MLRDDDNETEILLGNKQLLGIFFIVAILLGIAFYGGYMVGKSIPAKKVVAAAASQDSATSQTANAAAPGETHTLPGDSATSTEPNPTDATDPNASASAAPPLGTPKAKKRQAQPPPVPPDEPAPAPVRTESATFAPEPGEQFLQVTAVGRDEALGVANVLHAKGFRAHAVPKPGNPKVYRVLIGPLRDAGDLSTTRDALRKVGFREVIVQKY